jgi:ribonuclease-3
LTLSRSYVELKYHFKTKTLIEEALLAAGASESRNDIEGLTEGNKRLALVGDAVLRLVILHDWFPSGTSTGKIYLLL